MTTLTLNYNVKSIRANGLECRWTRTRNGAPIISGRMDNVGGGRWYFIDDKMWDRAQEVGIAKAFQEHCAFGMYFSV